MNDTRETADCAEMAQKPGRAAGEELLVAALAAGCSTVEAARRSGLSRRTVNRRLADPGFRREVTEARSRTVDAALGRVTESLAAAADALQTLLASESDAIRLGAARAIFEVAGKMRDSVEFEERLLKLEEAQRVQSQEQA